MATKDYQSKIYEEDFAEKRVDSLTVEEALQININGKPFTVTMRTPGDDKALVRGLLHSEGIIKSREFKPELVLEKENEQGVITKVNLSIPESELGEGYSNSRSLLSVSSCGICGKTELEDLGFMGACLNANEQFDRSIIPSSFEHMESIQKAFKRSGGSHAAVAVDSSGEMICYAEDIGRHNAVDKVVGKLILEDTIQSATLIAVSGRISYEIVIKCFKARVPVLAAVSAPSSLAVDYAKELGITLFAFCRGKKATCYSHLERIKENKNNNTQAS
jgi:FdhD protein